jgi:hypothetical protein
MGILLIIILVIAGLDPAIHLFEMDARVEPAHDE